MTGNTITKPAAAAGSSAMPASLTWSRAARELGLRRAEFDLAVHLGRVRTVSDAARAHEPPGAARARRRVTREEIDRIRAMEGFPEVLRADVSTVSAPEGARTMGITTARFTRLARLGLVTPVRFYLNRYRTVVWLYLVEELRDFAAAKENEALLSARLPETLRSQLDSGTDLRARNWRGRHAGFLLRLVEDPWAKAAITASLLDADEVADVVDDPHERAYLAWLRPERPDQSPAGSPASRVVDELVKADAPEELEWLRSSLSIAVTEARNDRPAPRLEPAAPLGDEPDGAASPTPQEGGAGQPETVPEDPPARPKRLLARLRRSRE
ncbi:hypothetical protein GCM10018793_08630 [Streptomyces sulfonofaciens]|uniref:Uncharacterized protein n=1 Tax=Streptomyces sulfonofaciens TaxID=68272 RepID=A0A919FUD0_9ACTN|nr:DUF6397 family protein [Streptomyces sulfonofaciens]GHH72119.1 hypothetical protein GCM10018793_08630 [Streptomyces sulfonofaciens]